MRTCLFCGKKYDDMGVDVAERASFELACHYRDAHHVWWKENRTDEGEPVRYTCVCGKKFRIAYETWGNTNKLEDRMLKHLEADAAHHRALVQFKEMART